MGRPIKPEAIEMPDHADDAAFAQATDAINALAVAHSEAEAHARDVARQMGYMLPADSTDPDLIQRDIAANMRRSVESCLEVGKGLAVLKAACGHGNFISRLEVLGLERNVAARFISAAMKFSNAPTSAHLSKAIGTQSKLFELLVLDDAQAQELIESGETDGITLDDIERMGVRELRAALREARSEASAKDARRAALIERNEMLATAAERIRRETPDEVEKQIHAEAAEILAEVLGMVNGRLRNALEVLNSSSVARDDIFMAAMLGQVGAAVNALRDDFDLPDLSDARDAQLAADVAKWAAKPAAKAGEDEA